MLFLQGVLTKDELYEELSLGGGVAGLVEQHPTGFVRVEAELDPPPVPALQPQRGVPVRERHHRVRAVVPFEIRDAI